MPLRKNECPHIFHALGWVCKFDKGVKSFIGLAPAQKRFQDRHNKYLIQST